MTATEGRSKSINSRRPRVTRAPRPRVAKPSSQAAWKIHPDYNLCDGKWYPTPATLGILGKKVPSGCAWALINFVNAAMNDNFRVGNEFSKVPAEKWSDKRTHGLATEPMSMSDLAKHVGFCLRAVEYNVADMVKRGGLARLPGEDRLFQYTVPFLHFDKVLDPEPTTHPADPDAADLAPEAEAEPAGSSEIAPPAETEGTPDVQPTVQFGENPKPRRFRARGSKRIETPTISGLVLSPSVAQQVEFDFEVVGGEMRINGFELLSNAQNVSPTNSEETANIETYSKGEPKANTTGEEKANALLIPEELRENCPQSFAVRPFLPFSALDGSETDAIVEAVESLRARTQKPLKYSVRVTGDYIEVAISPQANNKDEFPAPPPIRGVPSSLDDPFEEVFRALETVVPSLDDGRVSEMITSCRAARADVTGREMHLKIREKAGELLKRGDEVRNMFRLLLKLVPESLKGKTFELWRDRQAKGAGETAVVAPTPPAPRQKSRAELESERLWAAVHAVRKERVYEED